jgi:hypothetical protein
VKKSAGVTGVRAKKPAGQLKVPARGAVAAVGAKKKAAVGAKKKAAVGAKKIAPKGGKKGSAASKWTAEDDMARCVEQKQPTTPPVAQAVQIACTACQATLAPIAGSDSLQDLTAAAAVGGGGRTPAACSVPPAVMPPAVTWRGNESRRRRGRRRCCS